MLSSRALSVSPALVALVAACSGSTASVPSTTADPDASVAPTADAGPPVVDDGDAGAAAAPDSGMTAPPSREAGASGDGAPTRAPCTASLGSGLSTAHARLDGYVVAVIAPRQGKQCNGDASHVHVQVLVGKAVYDVAVNVDGNMTERDEALVGGPWAEGWHTTDSLDYPTALGAHSSDFKLTGASVLATEIEKQLAAANHVSVFCTGYATSGCHLVHRKRNGQDGALVIDPLAPVARWLLFDFSTDTF
jgi:hypothetical protein